MGSRGTMPTVSPCSAARDTNRALQRVEVPSVYIRESLLSPGARAVESSNGDLLYSLAFLSNSSHSAAATSSLSGPAPSLIERRICAWPRARKRPAAERAKSRLQPHSENFRHYLLRVLSLARSLSLFSAVQLGARIYTFRSRRRLLNQRSLHRKTDSTPLCSAGDFVS